MTLSEDPTPELPEERSFEARVLAEFAAVRGEVAAVRADIARLDARQQKFEERLTTLEEKADSRLSETRPIWEAVQLAIKHLDLKFDTVLSDLYDVRTNYRAFDKRLMKLEAR
ncbi:MAG: hypothetical protein ABI596_05705 [Pyrinomonadaceae bacterium]